MTDDDRHTFKAFIERHRVTEVECLVPDMTGIPRGKILPAGKFLKAVANHSLRIPEAVFTQTATGANPDERDVINPAYPDVSLTPDLSTLRIVPWYDEPTAQVICDAHHHDGRPVAHATRYVLQRVLDLYRRRGWQPVIAPELEFYLVDVNADPDIPLQPPIGRSGRREGRQSFGIDAVNEFDPIFEDVYDHCEAQEIDIDTLQHEEGAGQIEINFNHGEPLALADQVFLFKRTVRQTALSHKIYATFMAKPMQHEPGSAMHIHLSLLDADKGGNLFADPRTGENTALFRHFLGGMQHYITRCMPMLAPNVNSFRRLVPWAVAPVNTHWGYDNRTVGLRVPISDAENRRVENRVAGADANPYLAVAASLLAGYLGMAEAREPLAPVTGNANHMDYTLPRHQFDALARLKDCQPLVDHLGEAFVKAVELVRLAEFEEYNEVISSWERENLLLNV